MTAAVRRARLLGRYAAGLNRAEVLGDRELAGAWWRAMARVLGLLKGGN